ncbi:MAG: hypothetical protein U0Q16_04175 [Bryobacteraceae bacterium]
MLAVEVFDRTPEYDPKVDTIVRVEARRLRAKLADYYASAGAADPVRIDIPAGSYIPIFGPGKPATGVEAPAASGAPIRAWRVAAVVLLLCGAAGAVLFFRSRTPETTPTGPVRIAVMPFQNLGSDSADEIYADGLTEALTTDLAKIRGLQVISRTSSQRFKGTRQSLREIAALLHVSHVVEGSLQRSSDRCRVTVQLIRTADDVHVWSEAYELKFSGILALQRDTVAAIARGVHASISPSEQAAIGEPPSRSVEAYEALLRARKASKQYLFLGKDEYFEDSRKLLESALDRDPGYVDAIAEMGLLYGRKYQHTGDAHWRTLAEEAFRRALDRQPCHPEAAPVMANIQGDKGDLIGALDQAQKASQCNPGSSHARLALGISYMSLGLYEAAARELREAAHLDPLSLSAHLNSSWVLRLLRRPAEAVAAAKNGTDTEPGSAVAWAALGKALLEAGNLGEARPAFEKSAMAAPPAQADGVRELHRAAAGCSSSGPLESARAILRRYRQEPWVNGVIWGDAYRELVMQCGEPADIVAMLRSAPVRFSYRALIGTPALAQLRTDSAFREILRERYDTWLQVQKIPGLRETGVELPELPPLEAVVGAQ